MQAVTVNGYDATPALRDDLPAASPAAGELLVRVRASSVNPVDAAIAAGMLKGMYDYEFPVVLGRDYAGVVEETGAAVSGFSVGDEVLGFVSHASPAIHSGSWAELIAVPEGLAARKPQGVDFAAAGAAPLAGITAILAIETLGLREGDTVLIVGAPGGVGSFAVQLAVAAGARVIAPALSEDHDYLRDLGATELIDRDSDVAAVVREAHPDGVDALLDLASATPEDFDRNAAALTEGGRGVSSVGAAGEAPGRVNVMSESSPANLKRLADLLDGGTLRVQIQHSGPLVEAADLLAALGETHTQGKLAISVS